MVSKPVSIEGRPAYDPKSLYKLYIYGSRKGICSSRKLSESCKVNLEVKWIVGGIEPDFRTISDFRKSNIHSLKEIFHEFNRWLSGAVEWGVLLLMETKFRPITRKIITLQKINWMTGSSSGKVKMGNH